MTTQEGHEVSAHPEKAETVTFGRVKWFNNRAGYGFLTVTSGEFKDDDVFAHHSAIQVSKEQYRYLVQGEYVQFSLCEINNNNHKWQANNIRGIDGGLLMCETRLASRDNSMTDSHDQPPRPDRRNSHQGADDDTYYTRPRVPRTQQRHSDDEWSQIKRRPPRVVRSRPVEQSKVAMSDN
jgi:cold shock CspA family protein